MKTNNLEGLDLKRSRKRILGKGLSGAFAARPLGLGAFFPAEIATVWLL